MQQYKNEKFMTTLTLEIDNPTVLKHLKAVLKSIQGVKVLSNSSASAKDDVWEDVPNAVTLAAMKEAKSGNDAGIVSTDSLESFIASME